MSKHRYDGYKHKEPFRIDYGYSDYEGKYYVYLKRWSYIRSMYLTMNEWFYKSPSAMLVKVKTIMKTRRWKITKKHFHGARVKKSDKHGFDGSFSKVPYKIKFGYHDFKKRYYVKITRKNKIVKEHYYKNLSSMQKKVKQLYRTKTFSFKKKVTKSKKRSKAKTKRRK